MLIISMSFPNTPNFTTELLNIPVGGIAPLASYSYSYNNQANTQLRMAGIRAIGDIVREVSKGIVSALRLLDSVMKEPNKKSATSQNNKDNTSRDNEKFKVDVS